MRAKTKTPKKDVALHELLRNSFAEEEIHDVLLGALLSLDKTELGRLVKRLEKETGETLQQVMDSYGKRISGTKPAPGRGMICQDWDRVIGDVTIRSDGEIATAADGQQNHTRLGNVDIRANDDVMLEGERVEINGPRSFAVSLVNLSSRQSSLSYKSQPS